MKKLITLIGLMVSVTAIADDIVKMPVQDFVPTGMDYVYEIKTTKFDKVLLDCQSLRMGMSFSNAGVVKSDIYLNMEMCDAMVDFFVESKNEGLPACIGLDHDHQELIISRETDECI